jgi:hypothetical protein
MPQANPSTWPSGSLPTTFHETHLEQSSSTPYAIVEVRYCRPYYVAFLILTTKFLVSRRLV